MPLIAVTGGKRARAICYTEARDLRDVARSSDGVPSRADHRRRRWRRHVGERAARRLGAPRRRRAHRARRHRPLPRGPGDGDRVVLRLLAVADAFGALADPRRCRFSATSSKESVEVAVGSDHRLRHAVEPRPLVTSVVAGPLLGRLACPSPFGGGVIGNTTGSGPVIEGSSPSPRASEPSTGRARRDVARAAPRRRPGAWLGRRTANL